MADRITVLREIAKEMKIPVANTCNEIDIPRIILQTKEMEDRGDDDCFGYLFEQGAQDCVTCEIKTACQQICATVTPADDESMKGVRWVNPNLTSYGFNRGTQGQAVVDLLLQKPRTTDEIKKYLIKEFKSTDDKAQTMWNYIKDRLKANGYLITFDNNTKLNTLTDKIVSVLDKAEKRIERKGKEAISEEQ
jgi:hypothetical protein